MNSIRDVFYVLIAFVGFQGHEVCGMLGFGHQLATWTPIEARESLDTTERVFIANKEYTEKENKNSLVGLYTFFPDRKTDFFAINTQSNVHVLYREKGQSYVPFYKRSSRPYSPYARLVMRRNLRNQR